MGFQNPLIPRGVESIVRETNSVAAGAIHDEAINAPTGFIYILRGLSLSASSIASATSGTHRFQLQTWSGATFRFDHIFGESNFGESLSFESGMWVSADVIQRPTSVAAQATVVKELMASSQQSLRVRYVNNTDADQGLVTMLMLMEKLRVEEPNL